MDKLLVTTAAAALIGTVAYASPPQGHPQGCIGPCGGPNSEGGNQTAQENANENGIENSNENSTLKDGGGNDPEDPEDPDDPKDDDDDDDHKDDDPKDDDPKDDETDDSTDDDVDIGDDFDDADGAAGVSRDEGMAKQMPWVGRCFTDGQRIWVYNRQGWLEPLDMHPDNAQELDYKQCVERLIDAGYLDENGVKN